MLRAYPRTLCSIQVNNPGGGGSAAVPTPGFFEISQNNGAGPAPTANKLVIAGFYLPYPMAISTIGFFVDTTDGSNNSDVGLYNSAGTLVANIGAQHLGSSGPIAGTIVQGTINEPAGFHYFAYTSVGTTLQLAQDSTGVYFTPYANVAFGTSSGGALPASIAAPAINPVSGVFRPWFWLY